ncbi:alpha/beta fold hydrolase [Ectobacillus panaciterrae]|uniref:alpha/beta fold hydrolase n=1 Tax=Ectobacillus panaciterrae TaxID=363872 RepID=UPI0004129BAE|nr:alpha/beta hydrolase [Ectobacillus panaciterrae]
MDTKVSCQKVNVNGIELYYEYIDESNNGPTIVFDSGYGWSLENWQSIREDVSKFAKIFMYDRENIGNSDKGNNPKHSAQIVKNLRVLLEKTHIKPPYILVGHSFGGANVRLYASKYPEEVAGVVLIDSCHEDQNKVMVPLFSKEVQEAYFGQFIVEGTFSELEESLEQVRGTNIGSIPLIVLTGDTQPFHTTESMAAWMKFQRELAMLSSNSKHVIVKEAGHAIHIDNPKSVVDAIREMVETIDK